MKLRAQGLRHRILMEHSCGEAVYEAKWRKGWLWRWVCTGQRDKRIKKLTQENQGSCQNQEPEEEVLRRPRSASVPSTQFSVSPDVQDCSWQCAEGEDKTEAQVGDGRDWEGGTDDARNEPAFWTTAEVAYATCKKVELLWETQELDQTQLCPCPPGMTMGRRGSLVPTPATQCPCQQSPRHVLPKC